MPRMNYHSVQLLLFAYGQWHRAVADAKRPNALTMDTLGAVVFAAAATEGFINEVAEHVDTYRRIGSDLIPNGEQKDKLNRLADVVLDLEERRRPVAEKYAAAWFALTGECADKGRAPFQAFVLLHRVRDGLMHLKAAREDEDHAGRDVTDALAQQGIALSGAGDSGLPWLDRLETPEVAEWACESARTIINALLDLAPPHPTIKYDPLDLWRRMFREHVGFERPT